MQKLLRLKEQIDAFARVANEHKPLSEDIDYLPLDTWLLLNGGFAACIERIAKIQQLIKEIDQIK